MTDREIRLELSKVAITSGTNIETAKAFYCWIVAAPEHEDKQTKWDNVPIEEFACKTRIKGTIIKRCKENGINTVGELIRCGAQKFSTYRNVGLGTISQIDDALEQYFGVIEWYKT